MPEIDVVKRIKTLCAGRNWTSYRLAKESGITYSTLNSLLNKGITPSIPTLSKICEGFGISLSQFFADDEVVATLTPEQHQLMAEWNMLCEENKLSAKKYIQFLRSQQEQSV